MLFRRRISRLQGEPLLSASEGDVDADADERLSLVLAEALRSLAHQQASLDNLRSRATVLVAAAALVSSLLGGRALQSKGVEPLTVIALIALFLVLASASLICMPVWTWRFRSSAKGLIEAKNRGFRIDEMRENLASDIEAWMEANQQRLDSLQWCFVGGVVLLFIEIAALTLQYMGVAHA